MKRFAAAVFALFCAALVFAQKSPYDGAPADTQVLLKKADGLIQKEQYESAFGALNALDDEFMLAKKIEIAINYFAQSMMHQMFAFKNLKKGETLYDVRSGGGSYSLVLFDPVKAVEEFKKKNGDKPVLMRSACITTTFFCAIGINGFCPKKNWYKRQSNICKKPLIKIAMTGTL